MRNSLLFYCLSALLFPIVITKSTFKWLLRKKGYLWEFIDLVTSVILYFRLLQFIYVIICLLIKYDFHATMIFELRLEKIQSQ